MYARNRAKNSLSAGWLATEVTWLVPVFNADLSYRGLALAGFDAKAAVAFTAHRTSSLAPVCLSDLERDIQSTAAARAHSHITIKNAPLTPLERSENSAVIVFKVSDRGGRQTDFDFASCWPGPGCSIDPEPRIVDGINGRGSSRARKQPDVE